MLENYQPSSKGRDLYFQDIFHTDFIFQSVKRQVTA